MHYCKHLREDSRVMTSLSSSLVSSEIRGVRRLDMLDLTPLKSVTKVETLSRTGALSPCQSEARVLTNQKIISRVLTNKRRVLDSYLSREPELTITADIGAA